MRHEQTYRQRLILWVLVSLVVLSILVSLLVYFEKNSAQSSITDYFNGFWFAIVTLTGVGYGDLYPATVYGRVIGTIFVLLSVCLYAVFLVRIAALMEGHRLSKKLGHHGTSFSHHTIILGWNDVAANVINQLIGVGKHVAIVSDDAKEIETINEKYRHRKNLVFALHTNYGNYESLNRVNIEAASVIFINFKDDTDKLVCLLNARKYYPDKDYVVILDNSDLKNAFVNAGAIYTVAKNEIASKMLASYIFEPDVAEYSEDMISYAASDLEYDIKQYKVNSSNPYIGREYQYAFLDLKKRFNVILIGISKHNEGGKRILVKNPSSNLRIKQHDYLILIVNGKSARIISKVFKASEGT